jgi:cytochrome c biogenesis factor
MRVEQIVILVYLGVAFVLAMCLLAYYCSRYNKEHPDVRFEDWMDGDKMFNLMVGSIFFPIGLLMLIIALPFKLIMKLYKIDK